MSDVDGNALDPSNFSKHFIIIFLLRYCFRTVPQGRKVNNIWFFPRAISAVNLKNNNKIKCGSGIFS